MAALIDAIDINRQNVFRTRRHALLPWPEGEHADDRWRAKKMRRPKTPLCNL